jgi:vacuolar-type H+-ATPase subunit I/STV1
MTEDTPLFDHIGKPLIAEQKSEAEQSGEFIESRTKSIMKVAEQIGPGSLVAHQQLSVMHQKLDEVDFDNHVVDYIDEWETVVTSQLDDEVKAIRELAKNRGKYFEKVGKLRVKVNSIEHRRKQDAPKKLIDQLDRNEKKLEECDVLYEKKANEVSIELYEATRRSWVDLYPVIKNAMKFEINRVGRESSTYGSFHNTLDALKIDYKDATKDTADAPNTGSAL